MGFYYMPLMQHKHVCLSANFKLSVAKSDVDKLVDML